MLHNDCSLVVRSTNNGPATKCNVGQTDRLIFTFVRLHPALKREVTCDQLGEQEETPVTLESWPQRTLVSARYLAHFNASFVTGL